MSLVSLAIRICLERTLSGRTYAENRVYDSQITPVDQTVQAGQKPLIIISTDDDTSEIERWGFLCPSSRKLEIVIDMVLATFVRAQVGSGDGQLEIIIPHTDAGMEASLSFMQHQVLRAISDGIDPWAELLKEFINTPQKMIGRRGAGAEKGIRFAARQLVITCDPIPEPDFGETIPPDGPWGKLLALMDADLELNELAVLLRAEIEAGSDLPSWRRFQASRGWTDAQVRNAGFAPVDETETGEAPVLAEATIEGQGSEATVPSPAIVPEE